MSCKVHPQIIVSGWRKSMHVAQKALEDAAVDHSSDEQKFKEDLMNIARTTLSSKILMQHRDHFANLAVEAVLRLKVKVVHLYMYYMLNGCVTLYSISYRNYHKTTMTTRFTYQSSLRFFTNNTWDFSVPIIIYHLGLGPVPLVLLATAALYAFISDY